MRSTDASFVSALVLLDLSAAFDTVDHGILLKILAEQFGVENLELDWFHSTLNARRLSQLQAAARLQSRLSVVIGIEEFNMCTEDIKESIDRFIINHHLYADDSKLLAHMKINAVMEHRLDYWRHALKLVVPMAVQLNPDNTELIWFGSRENLVKLRQLDVMSLNLCSVAVDPVDFVHDLGVILDSKLSKRVHISKISSICFFNLHRLRKLRPLIDTASAQRLASTFIPSMVDYCNAVLADLPTSTLAPLQRILNAAARFVAGATLRTYVSGIMKSLHWLPIAYRIHFEFVCLFMASTTEPVLRI